MEIFLSEQEREREWIHPRCHRQCHLRSTDDSWDVVVSMEADWDEISRVVVPPSGPHMLPMSASTVSFDDSQELLWIGNDHVSVL